MQNKRSKLSTNFDKNGFIVIKKVLTQKKINLLKKLTIQNCEKFSNFYEKFDDNFKIKKKKNKKKGKDLINNAQTIHNLHNKSIEYVRLMSHEKIYFLAKKFLQESLYKKNEDIIIHKSSARNPIVNASKQILHTDSRFISSTKPLALNVFWVLDDFTSMNGALRVVPGSHKLSKFPGFQKKYKNEKLILAKKGDVIIFDASLWHGNSKKIKNKDRWAIIFRYTPWFYRPAFQELYNTPIKIFNKLTDEEKTLLGFKHTAPKSEFNRIGARDDKFKKPYKFDFNFLKKK